MSKKKRTPNNEDVKKETATPLPERDALSVLSGAGMGIATIAPEFNPDPNAPAEATVPGEAAGGPERWPVES
jgi:hypothetical protein